MPEESIADLVAKCRVLLLDVEGTTTSISFVKDKLFPYAAQHVRGVLEAGWGEEEVRAAVAALRQLAISDAEHKREGVVPLPGEDASKEEQIDGVVRNVEWLMSQDRKEGALKTLQGLIWQKGYDSGELLGHVFEDVAGSLEAWVSRPEHRVYIYSSGSEQAQRLLFAHSEAGDLRSHIHGHFDTSVGHKREAQSYTNIAERIGSPPEEILFLTDILEEAEAARAAGVRCALVCREGNAPLPPDVSFPTLRSLAELAADPAPAKRKQDAQEEQPAKIAKVDDEQSTAPETGNMDVDAHKEAKDDETKDEPTETTAEKEKVELVIEEVVEPVDPEAILEVPMAVEEPIAETKPDDKTEDKENEKAEPADKMEPDESPPTAVTEIEEVLDEKLEEAAETIDMEPVVTEPESTEELNEMVEKECGELEKECDAILDKVKSVTELTQPLLEPLGEAQEKDASPGTADGANGKADGSNGKADGANGKADGANGKADGANGDGARLNGDNGDATHNGASNGNGNMNGDGAAVDGAAVNGDGAAEGEIKVKTVPAAEPSETPAHTADA